MRTLSNSEVASVSGGGGRSARSSCGCYCPPSKGKKIKNNNGFGNGPESGDAPGNSGRNGSPNASDKQNNRGR